MSYWDISQMAADPDLFARISAAVAVEHYDDHPTVWAGNNMLRVCSAPGWAQEYTGAATRGNAQPGKDPGVITDAQILESVQAVLAAEEATP